MVTMSRRPSTANNSAECPCGSVWFRLRRTPTSEPGSGAVALDERGLVTAFEGEPVCVNCGRTWIPRPERLRVV